jgi:hypothetical protein
VVAPPTPSRGGRLPGHFPGQGAHQQQQGQRYPAWHDPDGSILRLRQGSRLLLGNGDGTFQAAQSYAAGSLAVTSVAVGDFNGDGHLDLVVTNLDPLDPVLGGQRSGTVSVLLGNGDGTFQTAQSYVAGSRPQFVAVGDFNGDGIPDLAVSSPYSETVSLRLKDEFVKGDRIIYRTRPGVAG